jgi:hypothetical protein
MKLPRWRKPVPYSGQSREQIIHMVIRPAFILISSCRVQFDTRRALACLFSLLFLVGLVHAGKTSALSQTGTSDVRWLEEGKPIERQISAGDDAATAELMKRIYRGVLREKLTPAAALRAAQIEMLSKSHWQSPYYWGAFVLQGEWR